MQPVCAKTIHIILSDQNDAFIAAGKKIKQLINDNNTSLEVQLVNASALNIIDIDSNDLLIPIGNQAATSIEGIKSNTVLFSFVKANTLPRINNNNWSAVVLDQPVIRLVKAISPILEKSFKQRIVVAHSESNQLITQQLQHLQLTNENELDIVTLADTTKPAKQIEDKLFNAGALLAVNDNHVWQGKNAKWMLYQAYRYKVPVVGYSKKFLKAGALVSVYSSLDQIAKATAKISMAWAQSDGGFATQIHYANYNIEYNQNIARALNILTPKNQQNIEADE
jgi:ABC-type uncharacterized transport system substrate-binding protein